MSIEAVAKIAEEFDEKAIPFSRMPAEQALALVESLRIKLQEKPFSEFDEAEGVAYFQAYDGLRAHQLNEDNWPHSSVPRAVISHLYVPDDHQAQILRRKDGYGFSPDRAPLIAGNPHLCRKGHITLIDALEKDDIDGRTAKAYMNNPAELPIFSHDAIRRFIARAAAGEYLSRGDFQADSCIIKPYASRGDLPIESQRALLGILRDPDIPGSNRCNQDAAYIAMAKNETLDAATYRRIDELGFYGRYLQENSAATETLESLAREREVMTHLNIEMPSALGNGQAAAPG